MVKRIVTRIGNVFCVEIDGKYKRFFQYIANDLDQLNSSVIRVFKSCYPIDYKPKIDEIIKGEVGFYAHTMLRAGIADSVWYKVGTSKELGLEGMYSFYWGNTSNIKILFGPKYINDYGIELTKTDIVDIDPLVNWTIWNASSTRNNIGILPKELIDNVEISFVFPYETICSRIKYGYYVMTCDEYDVLKRQPWEDVDSYVKMEEGDIVRYSHFLGQKPKREMVVSRFGIVRLSAEHPESQGETLRSAEFWETNWQFNNFIDEAEFENLWNQSPEL